MSEAKQGDPQVNRIARFSRAVNILLSTNSTKSDRKRMNRYMNLIKRGIRLTPLRQRNFAKLYKRLADGIPRDVINSQDYDRIQAFKQEFNTPDFLGLQEPVEAEVPVGAPVPEAGADAPEAASEPGSAEEKLDLRSLVGPEEEEKEAEHGRSPIIRKTTPPGRRRRIQPRPPGDPSENIQDPSENIQDQIAPDAEEEKQQMSFSEKMANSFAPFQKYGLNPEVLPTEEEIITDQMNINRYSTVKRPNDEPDNPLQINNALQTDLRYSNTKDYWGTIDLGLEIIREKESERGSRVILSTLEYGFKPLKPLVKEKSSVVGYLSAVPGDPDVQPDIPAGFNQWSSLNEYPEAHQLKTIVSRTDQGNVRNGNVIYYNPLPQGTVRYVPLTI